MKKADKFNPGKWLVENKLTNNSKISEENQPTITDEDKTFLEGEIEKFLSNSLFNSKILDNDSEDFSPTLEEQAIKFIIDNLQERIDYYN